MSSRRNKKALTENGKATPPSRRHWQQRIADPRRGARFSELETNMGEGDGYICKKRCRRNRYKTASNIGIGGQRCRPREIKQMAVRGRVGLRSRHPSTGQEAIPRTRSVATMATWGIHLR